MTSQLRGSLMTLRCFVRRGDVCEPPFWRFANITRCLRTSKLEVRKHVFFVYFFGKTFFKIHSHKYIVHIYTRACVLCASICDVGISKPMSLINIWIHSSRTQTTFSECSQAHIRFIFPVAIIAHFLLQRFCNFACVMTI